MKNMDKEKQYEYLLWLEAVIKNEMSPEMITIIFKINFPKSILVIILRARARRKSPPNSRPWDTHPLISSRRSVFN